MSEMIAVCSNKPRPTGPNKKRTKGWWAHDVYHLAHSGITTMCGRDRSEWLTIGPIETLDYNCCARCAAVAQQRRPSPEPSKEGSVGE